MKSSKSHALVHTKAPGHVGTKSFESMKKSGVGDHNVKNKPHKKRGKIDRQYSSIEEDDDDTEHPVIDYKKRHGELQKKWLVIIAHCIRLTVIRDCTVQDYQELHAELLYRRKRYLSFLKVASFIIKKSHWIKKRIARLKEIFRKHGWLFLLHIKCMKRHNAALAVRKLLFDFKHFRLAYIMLRYRSNAIRLQSRVRSFMAITNARVLALSKLWIKYEKQCRDYLLPKVKAMQLKPLSDIQITTDKNIHWENTSVTGVVLPELAKEVNSATKSAARLKITLLQGEELSQKVNMFEMNRRIKLMKTKRIRSQSPKRKKKKRIVITDTISVRERTIRNFLYECRRNFKQERFLEQTTISKSAKSNEAVNRISANLAVMLLKSRNEKDVLAMENSLTEFLNGEVENRVMQLYTGENSGKFHLMVEDYVRQKIDDMLYSL
jgi:hypothetical protein